VCHRADGSEVVFLGEIDIGGSDELGKTDFIGKGLDDILLPVEGETAASSEIREPEVLVVSDHGDLGREGFLRRVHVHDHPLEINLIHNGEDGNLEENGEEPVALGYDGKMSVVEARGDMLTVEAEVLEEIGIVLLDEADGSEIGDLVIREAKRAEMVDFLVDPGEHFRSENVPVPALELASDIRRGELVQDTLHHGKFIFVGIKQRIDNHPTTSI